MKSLILILILLSSFTCLGDYADKEEVRSGSVTKTYTKARDCLSSCVHLPKDYNPAYHRLFKKMVDDNSKPIYESKSQVQPCSGEADCIDKISSLACDKSSGYIALRSQDNTEAYCTKLLGFEKIESDEEIVGVDESLKAQFDSSETLRKQQDQAISSALLRIAHGKRVLALFLVRASLKNLTTEQVKQLNLTYSNVKDLLETGSLEAAKSEIESITPDGSMVTQSDKDALILEIESFLSL